MKLICTINSISCQTSPTKSKSPSSEGPGHGAEPGEYQFGGHVLRELDKQTLFELMTSKKYVLFMDIRELTAIEYKAWCDGKDSDQIVTQ